jgi:hypothetical protein
MEPIASAQLRIRDKAILDGHEKEIAARDALVSCKQTRYMSMY